MMQFGLLLSCDSNLKSDWDFQLSGSGSNSLNWRKLPGRFPSQNGLGTRLACNRCCLYSVLTNLNQRVSYSVRRVPPGNHSTGFYCPRAHNSVNRYHNQEMGGGLQLCCVFSALVPTRILECPKPSHETGGCSFDDPTQKIYSKVGGGHSGAPLTFVTLQ